MRDVATLGFTAMTMLILVASGGLAADPEPLNSNLDLEIGRALLDPEDVSATVNVAYASSDHSIFGNELAVMFREAGSGYWQEERAAWIVQDSTGLVLIPWPFSASRQAATWTGPRPTVAVAQIHTHPASHSPRPTVSGANSDYSAAQHWRIPVYVLTRDAIWKVSPGPLVRGSNPVRVVDGRWWRPFLAGKS